MTAVPGNGKVTIISIHAPRVGSDKDFLTLTQTEAISIHAPRVGSDTRRSAMPI